MTDTEREGNRRRNITYRERNRGRLRAKRRARYAASRESLGLPYESLAVILERAICFNWSNLQPLFAKDNLLKGDKIL